MAFLIKIPLLKSVWVPQSFVINCNTSKVPIGPKSKIPQWFIDGNFAWAASPPGVEKWLESPHFTVLSKLSIPLELMPQDYYTIKNFCTTSAKAFLEEIQGCFEPELANSLLKDNRFQIDLKRLENRSLPRMREYFPKSQIFGFLERGATEMLRVALNDSKKSDVPCLLQCRKRKSCKW